MRLSGRSLRSLAVYLLLGAAASAQTITEFPLPPATYPIDITTGPDGNLWFTSSGRPGYGSPLRVARFSTSGEVTFFPLGLATIDSRIVPVVGSTAGVGGSFFRTSVQLHKRSTRIRRAQLRRETRYSQPSAEVREARAHAAEGVSRDSAVTMARSFLGFPRRLV